MSFFEAGMLICFGAAWPVSIYKSLTSKSIKGKSLLFSVVVLVGYASGIMHKIFIYTDWVLVLYVLNFLMVALDIALFIRNKRIEAKTEAQPV